jgi:hypothetical protein
MPTTESHEPEGLQRRPIASSETGFWAFLNYPVVYVPVIIFTILGCIGLFIAALVR